MSNKIVTLTNLQLFLSNIKEYIMASLSKKQDILVSGKNIKTVNGESILDGGNIEFNADTANSVNITYSELKALKESGTLIPGRQYRIIDYITTTSQENTEFAEHQFDIIVTADSESVLSHIARAAKNEYDTYFTLCDVESWQLWYDIDNNTEKYKWADKINGKGVIYRMIDERGNDCPYDFKNILFYTEQYTSDTTTDNFYYTFSYIVDGILYDGSVEKKVDTNYCSNNIIHANNNKGASLNANIFKNVSLTSKCINNVLNTCCYNNVFGDNCSNNIFGNDCYNNILSNGFSNNKIGNNCYNIKCNNETNNIQNYILANGLNLIDTNIQFESNIEHELKVAKNSSGEIKIYCEADLIN